MVFLAAQRVVVKGGRKVMGDEVVSLGFDGLPFLHPLGLRFSLALWAFFSL